MYTNHIILDFEMNPVSKKNKDAKRSMHREIIEIGAVKLNANNERVDSFSCFVKPDYSTDVTQYITKLTGIKSTDVHKALSLKEAMELFSDWIGDGKTRIYSWSDSDLNQLKQECDYKNIEMPSNMQRWIDFQPLFPRLMEIHSVKQLMSLREAASWYGLEFDSRQAHRALYDAEVTADLVAAVLTGDYRKQRNIYKNTLKSDQDYERTGFRLGDACGGILKQFLMQMELEPELAR